MSTETVIRPLHRRVAREVAGVSASLVVMIAVAFAGMSTMSACGWFKTESKDVEVAFIDCAKQDLTAGSLLSDVATAIQNGGAGWQSTLASIGTKYGEDALACAVKAISEVFTPSGHAEASPMYQRSQQMMSLKKWQYSR